MCESMPPHAQTVTTSLGYQAPLLPQSAGEVFRVTEEVPLQDSKEQSGLSSR